ncbi:MAG: terminase family protein [Methanothrix sp.]|nr:terminase family protein [Methanothrix sp.]
MSAASAISSQDAAIELLSRRRARESLIEFTKYTKSDYQVNWHHNLVASYLDSFVAGDIKRLMVFMPPRNGKSELVSRRLPAYIFGKNPDASIIACSYSADLSSRMNRDTQRIMTSQEYTTLFPESRLNDKNVRTTDQESYLRNSELFEIVGHQGMYRSAGVGGGITGMGCVYGIIDDPIKNREEANSATYREKIKEWYTSTFYTRLEKDAGVLITLTRWHEDDLAGWLINEADNGGEQWTVVSIPSIADGELHPDDPRVDGDPLWPDKFNLDRLDKIRAVLGPYDFSALHQQRPTPKEGGMWKYEDINQYRVRELPIGLVRIVVAVDPEAKSTESSAETGIIVAGLGEDKHAYVMADMSVKGSPNAWGSRAIQAYHTFKADRIVAEINQGGDMVESIIRNIDPSISYKSVHASRGKQTRAEPIAALYEQGKVHHIGNFPKLEDQMCRWVQGDKSPDRLDALVWGLTEIMPSGSDSSRFVMSMR